MPWTNKLIECGFQITFLSAQRKLKWTSWIGGIDFKILILTISKWKGKSYCIIPYLLLCPTAIIRVNCYQCSRRALMWTLTALSFGSSSFSGDNFSILYLLFWMKHEEKTPGSRTFFQLGEKLIQVFFTYCHNVHKFLFSEEIPVSFSL